MEVPREQPSYEAVIQHFLAWVKRCCSHEIVDPDDAAIRPPFMTRDNMIQFFQERDNAKLREIISVQFGDVEPIFINDVIPDNVAVFCTLLSIGKGGFIKHFRRHPNLSDNALPFFPENEPPNWPDDPNDPDFLQNFCKAQWKFCVPALRWPFVDKAFPKDMVLPIVYKELLNSGSSAKLWLIKLEPSYNQLISEGAKKKLGKSPNTFVLKTYFTSEAENYYKTEVSAFRNLGPHPNIIGFHGSFTRGESYNVLLEYADKGTLTQYFEKEVPPGEGEDIIQFWEALFQIIDALMQIHKVKPEGGNGPQIFQGRHQDVKPDNILVVSNGSVQARDSTFKLADLGISHFERKKHSRQGSSSSLARGTRTYGAPESYRPDDGTTGDTVREGQNVDVFSLGCIYSEAARWLLDGQRGIDQYRQERTTETALIPGFRDGDCFHDGNKVLSAVRESHKKVTRNLRLADFITNKVIDKLIDLMLSRSEARPTAFQLWHHAKEIVELAKKDLADHNNLPLPAIPARGTTYPLPSRPAPPNPPPGILPSLGFSLIPNADQLAAFSHRSQSGSSDSELLHDSPRIIAEQDALISPGGAAASLVEESNRIHPSHNGTLLAMVKCRGREGEGVALNNGNSAISHNGHASLRISDHDPPSDAGPKSSRGKIELPISSSPSKPAGPYSWSSPPQTQDSPPLSHYHMRVGQAGPQGETRRRPSTPPPYLSVEDTLEWKRERKDSNIKKRINDSHLQDRLKSRDHIFLVDDSVSMRPHCKNVWRVFEALSYLVKDVDPNGIDLYFTSSPAPVAKNCKTTKKLLQLVKNRRHQGQTDINITLRSILTGYAEALEKPKTIFTKFLGPVRPLNLYIFTNGIWEGECNPEHLIEVLVKKLVKLDKVRLQVGIQFISFGDDERGLERLEYLDSGLTLGLDIVDTEPHYGNVWKMLLGAINETFDRHNDKYTPQRHASSASCTSDILADKQRYG